MLTNKSQHFQGGMRGLKVVQLLGLTIVCSNKTIQQIFWNIFASDCCVTQISICLWIVSYTVDCTAESCYPNQRLFYVNQCWNPSAQKIVCILYKHTVYFTGMQDLIKTRVVYRHKKWNRKMYDYSYRKNDMAFKYFIGGINSSLSFMV